MVNDVVVLGDMVLCGLVAIVRWRPDTLDANLDGYFHFRIDAEGGLD